jgi:predicted RNase H-like nuclease (RuvC/YqgF family)
MNDTARNCAEKRAAEAANEIDRLLAENAQLANKVKRFEHAANELRASHLSALDTISNGIAREDAMRAEIGRLGEKLCAAAKTIAELNERIVSANLSERAKRTGVPA